MILLEGIGNPDLALLTVRASLGTFFGITGLYKLIKPDWHKSMLDTMTGFHIPFPRFNSWFVAGVEMGAGLGVLFGCLTPLAAFGLICVMAVALLKDGPRKIHKLAPGGTIEKIDDCFYLPETLYVVLAIVLICSGGGAFSLDAILVTMMKG